MCRIELLISAGDNHGGAQAIGKAKIHSSNSSTSLNHQQLQIANRPYTCVSFSLMAPSLQFVQVVPHRFHRIALHSVSSHRKCIPGLSINFAEGGLESKVEELMLSGNLLLLELYGGSPCSGGTG